MCRIKSAEEIIVTRLMNDVSQIMSCDFYPRADVVEIVCDLLGLHLCTRIHNQLTKVVITETEAYGGRRPTRAKSMFVEGDVAYVYLCKLAAERWR